MEQIEGAGEDLKEGEECAGAEHREGEGCWRTLAEGGKERMERRSQAGSEGGCGPLTVEPRTPLRREGRIRPGTAEQSFEIMEPAR